MHQVTACCLYKLLQDAYNEYVEDVEDRQIPQLSMDDWSVKRVLESPQFQFWLMIMKMELTILSFIRSIRKGNFDLYCHSRQELIPYFFANMLSFELTVYCNVQL